MSSFGLALVVVLVMQDKHQWMIPSWPDVLPRSQKLMFRTMVPSMALFFLVSNEFFRRFTSFEVWATYNAFSGVLMVLFFGLCTVIIIPAIGDERLAAFDEKQTPE